MRYTTSLEKRKYELTYTEVIVTRIVGANIEIYENLILLSTVLLRKLIIVIMYNKIVLNAHNIILIVNINR